VVLAAGAAWAALPTALLLAVATGLRLRLVAGLAALSLVAQAAALLPLVVGDRAPAGPALTVMTVNLHVGYASQAQVVAAVRRHGVDVLAVQEMTPHALEALQEAGLEQLLPHSVVHAGGGPSGSGLWSRHELTPAPAWDTTFRSSAGRLQWRGREITVQSVHPYAPAARDARPWEGDLRLLEAAADADPATPTTVVAGDLNGTLGHRQVRRLLEGRWRDAAELAGAGQLRTWTPSPRLPALIDLDHVLVPPGLTVRSVRAVTIGGSDHRAVVARLVPA
jgi:endonuclease/exonuclease/phosphatase family metal-dependent hydrolase